MMILPALKRASMELILLIGIGVVICYSPASYFLPDAKLGMMNLFIVKLVSVSCGILHAHAGRKMWFPYMNLKEYIDENKMAGIIFLVFWYATIIYSWAHGG